MTAQPQSRPAPAGLPEPSIPTLPPGSAVPPTLPGPVAWPAGPAGSPSTIPATVGVAQPLPPPAVVPTLHARRRPSRSTIALTLSALVAVAGVSFAIGRLSADEAAVSMTGPAFAGALALPGEASLGAAADTTVGTTAATNTSEASTAASGLVAMSSTDSGGDASVPAADEGASEAGSLDATSTSLVSVTELDDPAAPPDGMGAPPQGGFVGPRGLGVQGTITDIEDGVLTIATALGTSTDVGTDDTTSYLLERSVDPGDLALGDTVSVQAPSRAPADEATTSSSAVAQQVTRLAGDAAVPRGPGVTEGALTETTGSSLTLTLADGSSTTIATDASTAWVAQEVIEAAALRLGDSVTAQLARRPAGGDASTSEPAVATQVTVSVPTV